jgi:hypothetical protein
MDIEHLTKHQIILVTLLVSFVSSIATGIVCVTLLNQDPQPITQTINHIIERTVEKVVPSDTGAIGGKTVTKETVIVAEDDAVVNAIAQTSKVIVRVFSDDNESDQFIGMGVVVSRDGRVAVRIPSGFRTFNVRYPDGSIYGAQPLVSDDENQITILSISQNPLNKQFQPAVFMNSSNAKLGQKVVAITGDVSDSVTTGIISNITSRVNGTHERIRVGIYADKFLYNSVIANLSGEIVGFKIGAEAEDGYIPANIIRALIK